MRKSSTRCPALALAGVVTLASGALVTGALAGCAHDADVPSAAELLGEDDSAMRVGGVRLRVDGDPGLALPQSAADDVTAVRVVVENHGNVPLRIRYAELRLIEASGEQRVALPPLLPRGEAGFVRTSFGHTRFLVAPGYERFYDELRAWEGPFREDPYYAATYYTRWVKPLPTTEMVARALPEGVLEPGGRLDGLIYFEGISPFSDEATLVADLVNADTGAHLGTAHIDFKARGGVRPFALR